MLEGLSPTTNQRLRAERCKAILDEKMVPMWGDASICLYVQDDAEVGIQSPQEVARRTIVLWAVSLKADGFDHGKCLKIINDLDIAHSVSPSERAFLDDPDPRSETSRSLVWRLEAIWVLLWALGYVGELPWPSAMCDVPRIAEVLNTRDSDPRFIDEANLIPTAEILDAQDLTLKIHWAIRDAYIKGLPIPENLDWREENRVPVTMCSVVGVVEQRHYALNWILKFMDPDDWDSVDTPT